MSDWTITIIILVAIAVLVFIAVKRGWVKARRGAFTGMVVYHDWTNRDTQKGVEVIVERNAGKKENENESGEPDFEKMINHENGKKEPQ
jgi:hypothetical protein